MAARWRAKGQGSGGDSQVGWALDVGRQAGQMGCIVEYRSGSMVRRVIACLLQDELIMG
jgi:hypothetical protein